MRQEGGREREEAPRHQGILRSKPKSGFLRIHSLLLLLLLPFARAAFRAPIQIPRGARSLHAAAKAKGLGIAPPALCLPPRLEGRGRLCILPADLLRCMISTQRE